MYTMSPRHSVQNRQYKLDCHMQPCHYPQKTQGKKLEYTATLVVLLCLYSSQALALSSEEQSFYRAAYVLQQLAPQTEWPAVTIPPEIRRDDKASALLHHSDTIFVISQLARDLEGIPSKKAHPETDRYAAYAHALLGRKADAATAMQRYLHKNSYQNRNYLFAVQNQYEAGNYPAVRQLVAAWNRHDPGGRCEEKRLSHLWRSYTAQNMHQQAQDVIGDNSCTGWKATLWQARSLSALEQDEQADRLVQRTLHRNPKIRAIIEATWQRLQNNPLAP